MQYKKFRNKTLTILALGITLGFLLCGVVTLMEIQNNFKILIIVLLYIVMSGDEGIYRVLRNRYIGNFTNSKILPKIYSANSVIDNIMRMIIGFIGSLVLSDFNIKYTMLIIGTIFTGIVYILYKYMKTRLGLKPNEYKKEDIEYIET